MTAAHSSSQISSYYYSLVRSQKTSAKYTTRSTQNTQHFHAKSCMHEYISTIVPLPVCVDQSFASNQRVCCRALTLRKCMVLSRFSLCAARVRAKKARAYSRIPCLRVSDNLPFPLTNQQEHRFFRHHRCFSLSHRAQRGLRPLQVVHGISSGYRHW